MECSRLNLERLAERVLGAEILARRGSGQHHRVRLLQRALQVARMCRHRQDAKQSVVGPGDFLERLDVATLARRNARSRCAPTRSRHAHSKRPRAAISSGVLSRSIGATLGNVYVSEIAIHVLVVGNPVIVGTQMIDISHGQKCRREPDGRCTQCLRRHRSDCAPDCARPRPRCCEACWRPTRRVTSR